MRLLGVAVAAVIAIACGGPEAGPVATEQSAAKKCKDPAGCCGDGIVQPGEACDSGGVDTATCNGGTCTRSVCGDAYANAAAGEACDTGGNSATCDADCTVPACGDGFVNPAASEQCDTGGVPVPGCSAQCLLTCG
jgi:hypothetical protein